MRAQPHVEAHGEVLVPELAHDVGVGRTVVLSIIGVGELLLKTQQIVGRNFMTLEFYLLAGALYFAVNFCIERTGKRAERRFALR